MMVILITKKLVRTGDDVTMDTMQHAQALGDGLMHGMVKYQNYFCNINLTGVEIFLTTL